MNYKTWFGYPQYGHGGCPSCGYCQHCGRGGHGVTHYYGNLGMQQQPTKEPPQDFAEQMKKFMEQKQEQ